MCRMFNFLVFMVVGFAAASEDQVEVGAFRSALGGHARILLDDLKTCKCQGPNYPVFKPSATGRHFVTDPYLNQNLDLLRDHTRALLEHCACHSQIALVGHNREMSMHDPSLNVIETRSAVEEQIGKVFDRCLTAVEHCCQMHGAYQEPIDADAEIQYGGHIDEEEPEPEEPEIVVPNRDHDEE